MQRIIKTIPCDNGVLYATSAGQRRQIARFSGRVEITEHTTLIPLLGTVQKGTKHIRATFIVCEDIDYICAPDEALIHSGKVYDATAVIAETCLTFAGLRFADSDPVCNELTFEFTDMELIQRLLTTE